MTAAKADMPKGLGLTAGKLWRQVTTDYTLRVDETMVLESACRTVDILSRLEDAMADAPLTVSGSMGQMREHPLLAEARQQRVTLARLLAQLKLPDLDELELFRASGRSSHARKAAEGRWTRRGSA